MVIYIIISLYVLFSILIIFKLLLDGVRPTKTLAWLLAIFTIPVGGILLYLILGRNRRKNKFFDFEKSALFRSYSVKIKESYEAFIIKDPKETTRLAELIIRNSDFYPVTGNRIQILKNGEVTFKEIFKAIATAKRFIHLEYYIFEEGQLSDELFALFETKIKEGVTIRVLYDGIGSFSLGKKYINKLEEIGVEIERFLPIRFGKFLSSINYRNHRKIIVIDNTIAFTGGINVSDKYVKGDPELGNWKDMHLKLEGPVVQQLQLVFGSDWFYASGKDIDLQTLPSKVASKGDHKAQVVYSGPDSDYLSAMQLFFAMITDAQEYVYITNPYIIPNESILHALEVAALSGVDIRILLSNNSDSKLVRWCVRSYFERLLKAGVKIYLINDGFLHSKTIAVDDRVCSIGTANLDLRSFEQNYEVNVVVYDHNLCVELKADFLKESHAAIVLNYRTFVKRPWSHKFKEAVAKIFSPIL
ncbi:cardiolipin synthase [Aquimarina brevivitae]|uniref:Cardiolipin synthase n=1 Tax=Aquimarina brevivitae TaxID=323412 RepID=A0A4Q7PIQ7_9FLAO|nr:cardiolipin synthase [Aquimarina brevivitae]RZS99710.1 cardiolipin synthase [Aquimarina brevivitae]